MVSAVFKMMIYDNSPQLAQRSLTALIIISVLSKIFYPELRKLVEVFYQRLNMISWAPYANAWWVAGHCADDLYAGSGEGHCHDIYGGLVASF